MAVSKPVDPDLGDPKPTRRVAGISVMSVFISFAKKISTVAIVYLLGLFDFSAAWLVAPVIYSVIREEWRKEKELKRNVAKAAAMCSEKDIILARVDDLPSWVFFPDIERAEWVNRILRQVWPHVNHYARTLIKESIEPAVAESLAAYKLSGFQFQKMILGTIPPRVGGIKVYDKNVSRNEIIMDIDIFYAGDCDISFTLGGVSGGIKDFQIHGMVRVVMKPLIPVIPMVGGLQIFFLNNPNIDFNLVGAADVLDMPGLSDLLRRIIVEQVALIMVLPNKLPIHLSDAVPGKALKTPEPEGVLRVHVIGAKNLMKKDISVLGKGKSDPYAIINVGAQVFRTQTIDNTVNPTWNYWCEFAVDSVGQQLIVQLKDHDDLSKKDSKLGSATVEINTVAKKGEVDNWITLDNAKHGTVHLRMSWLALSSEPSDLKAAMAETKLLQDSTMSTALLTVFVDSVKNLPDARPQSRPDPYVTLALGKHVEKTGVQYRTDSPVYETGFVFLVHDPNNDTLQIKVTDSKTTKEIGVLNYNIVQLMEKVGMAVDCQPFQLKKSGGESKIHLSMHLKILKKSEVTDFEEGRKSFETTPSRQGSLRDIPTPSPTPLKKQPSVSGSIKEPNNPKAESETLIETEVENLSESSVKRVGSIHSISSGKGEFGLGRILLTFKYVMATQKFHIVVHKIVNIPCPDPTNIPDPYVKIYLLPERHRDFKKRTEAMKDNCNPVYEQSFDYVISFNELITRQLEISVCTRKGIFSSQSACIGQTLVNINELDLSEGTTEWFDLVPEFHRDKDD